MTTQTKLAPDTTQKTQQPTHCTVSAKHIAAMYDRFESGLCDPSTCNAVALSVRQILQRKVRIFRRNGKAIMKTSHDDWTLPESVHDWLDRVDKGLPVQPFRFKLSRQFFD